jgi:predicted Zn-dependent protease
VIFSPGAFASLLAPLLLALNGSFAFLPAARGSKRRSGFAGQPGQALFDPQFRMIDDATLPDRPYSAPADHEGTLSQRTPLIVDGVVTGFYHNLVSAAQADTHSTGNGWRDLLEPPLAAPTNVCVSGGNLTVAEMLRSLDDGLLIDLIGESDDAIGLAGNFARTVVLAYQVKRGRIAGYVRGASASGDLYRALRNITALSSEGYWNDHVYAPYVQLEDIVISA